MSPERSKAMGFSIERKENNKGYTKNNIALACFHCNTIKSNFFTAAEMKEIAMKYVNPKWQKELENESI